MARSRNTTTPVTTTVTRDAADLLVARLNEIGGISFVRDAWENKAPEQYGVVELNGASTALWAGDTLVAQAFQLTVHLYVDAGGDEWISKVQQKLSDSCDGFYLAAHEYEYDINKNHWEWRCELIGPMQWEETVESGQT